MKYKTIDQTTYKWFEEEINELGYQVYRTESMVQVIDGLVVIATVYTDSEFRMNTFFNTSKTIPKEDMENIGDLCWGLASTPLLDREEPKKYQLRLKVLPPGQGNDTLYLNILTDKTDESRLAVGVRRRIPQWELPWRNEFTDKQIDELNRDYNVLAFYKKVEVEDE